MSLCRTTHFVWEGGGLSEAQMLFCSHLWKSAFSIRWTKNSATPDFFIQKVNGSAVLSDPKLCFPAALLKQNSPEKCKGNTTGDRNESQPTSWRQQQCTVLPTCPSPVISAHSPQKRLLTNLVCKTHCAILTYLYSHKDGPAVSLNDTRASVCSNKQETKAYSFTFFFTLGENHRFTFHRAVTQLELLPVNMYHKNEGKISKNLHNISTNGMALRPEFSKSRQSIKFCQIPWKTIFK